MTRLIHLTDLHFGLHRTELVAPLRAAILANRPDIVVVSGDLTQRALHPQFALAMSFLRGLHLPFMMGPGNHDLPAYNPFLRLFDPFRPYRAGAAADLTPVMQIGRLRLFGLNTAAPFLWRGGVVRGAEVDRICAAMRDGPQDLTNIVVCHHPLEEPPGFHRGETRGARAAMQRFADSGLHVTLSGHLHHWTAGLGISGESGRAILQMQTGTALCARARERAHGFAVMDVAAGHVSATPWIIDEAAQHFMPRPTCEFAYREGIWRADG